MLAWGERFRFTREDLAACSARIAHRGPDGQGVFFNHEEAPAIERPQIGLAHRRLAILDPNPRADQPFTDGEGRWIVTNGEIYNFRELRRELQALKPDRQWITECDTEVLLAAYAAWGKDCLRRLNGMYAFAVWTPAGVGREAELFVARDRMGQKPLYYAYDPAGGFAFSSELPAIRSLRWVNTEIDTGALVDYLAWGYLPSGTIYQGIRKLPPAAWLRVTAHGAEHGCYFKANEPQPPFDRPIATSDAVRQSREMVTEAVRRQLVADVPLGCFLSGGVDSSIIAAAMRAAVPRGQPVLTFSIGFEDKRYDETAYAREVAAHLGTEHREFIVRPDAAEDLPKLAQVFGEPFGDSSALPTHYLARETRRHVKVAISGDGGDELFGGYDRYVAMQLGRKVRKVPSPVLAWAKKIAGAPGEGSHPKSRRSRVQRFLATIEQPPAERYASYLRLFDKDSIRELVRPEMLAGAVEADPQRALTYRYDELLGGRDEVRAAMALDREAYLPEDLLYKTDRCSMLHALEVRSPFMDHELVHFASSLSTDQLIGRGRKRMLREAFAGDLPHAVFHRPKMGFAVPIGDWLKTSLRDMLRGMVGGAGSFAAGQLNSPVVTRLIEEHETGARDHSQRLYALLMLELWWRRRV